MYHRRLDMSVCVYMLNDCVLCVHGILLWLPSFSFCPMVPLSAHIQTTQTISVVLEQHTTTNANTHTHQFHSVDEWYFLVGWFCEYTSPLYFSLSLSQWTSLSTAMTFAKLYCNIITWLYASKEKKKYRIESFYLFRVFICLFSLYSFSLDSSTDCGKKYRKISM